MNASFRYGAAQGAGPLLVSPVRRFSWPFSHGRWQSRLSVAFGADAPFVGAVAVVALRGDTQL